MHSISPQNSLIPVPDESEIATDNLIKSVAKEGSTEIVVLHSLATISPFADEVARQHTLRDYLERKSPETIRTLHTSLLVFAAYLQEGHIQAHGIVPDLPHWQEADLDLSTWRDVTDGIVKGFVRWQLQQGYAMGSIGVRLSAVKTFCQLATDAGLLPTEQFARIRLIKGYSQKEKRRVDNTREITRIGKKKAEALVLTKEQVGHLKQQPDTPQGWRDRVLICLFFDHGLRCGEITQLKRKHVDLTTGLLSFYREKVDKHQIHTLSRDTIHALMNYFQAVELSPDEPLLRGSQKGKSGTRLQGGMSKRAITARVNTLGERIGIDKLSAHDGRHTWATSAERAGTAITVLADAGGWSSISTPANRYVKPRQIANKDVQLDY